MASSIEKQIGTLGAQLAEVLEKVDHSYHLQSRSCAVGSSDGRFGAGGFDYGGDGRRRGKGSGRGRGRGGGAGRGGEGRNGRIRVHNQ